MRLASVLETVTGLSTHKASARPIGPDATAPAPSDTVSICSALGGPQNVSTIHERFHTRRGEASMICEAMSPAERLVSWQTLIPIPYPPL